MKISYDNEPDDLTEFAEYVRANLGELMFDSHNVWSNAPATGLLLVRKGRMQAELCTFPCGVDIPEHRHPNLDTIEFYVSGDYEILCEGKSLGLPIEKMGSFMNNRGVRINAGVLHSAVIGDRGAVFVSCQRWPDHMKMTSIGKDWAGENYWPGQGK